jgi:Domain of unknown function DUF29
MTMQLETVTNLYNLDYQAWLLKTIEQLRTKNFDNIDWEILLEELESLSGSERRELQNRLRILLMHLLKYQYQPERRSSSWIGTIVEQFSQIEALLLASPSLKSYYLEIFSDCYSKAIRNASAETKLSIKAFPAESPFSPQNVINPDFIFSLINQDMM